MYLMKSSPMRGKMVYLSIFDIWHARLRECHDNYNQRGDSHFSSIRSPYSVHVSRSVYNEYTIADGVE